MFDFAMSIQYNKSYLKSNILAKIKRKTVGYFLSKAFIPNMRVNIKSMEEEKYENRCAFIVERASDPAG